MLLEKFFHFLRKDLIGQVLPAAVMLQGMWENMKHVSMAVFTAMQ